MTRRSPKYCLLAATAALSLTAACNNGSSSPTARGGSDTGTSGCKYHVGYSDPTSAQEIDKIQDQVLVAAGKRMGICVTVLDAALDVNKQLQAVNQFVAQKMDAIIVFPLSPSSLNAALGRAQAAGIKVIGTSAVVTASQPTGSIAPYDALYDQNSDVHGAKQLADYVQQKLPGGGNILGVGIGFPVPSLKFMVQNYKDFVTADRPGLKWLATVDNPSDDISGGRKVVAQAVTRFHGQKIDAVMAYNTPSGVGAYQALRSNGMSGTLIVAQNGDRIGVEGVNNGQLNAMIDLVPWRSALQIIGLTRDLLTGETAPKLTFGRVPLYTKETIGQRLDWDKAVQQVKSGQLTCANGGCPSPDEAKVPF